MLAGTTALSRRSLLRGSALVVAAVAGSSWLAGATRAQASMRLACWGDSLTFGSGGGGLSYPAELSRLLGLPVYNGGVVGERSSGVATRQGGRLPLVTVERTDALVPGGTFRVVLDGERPWWDRAMVIQEEGVLSGHVGDVHGILHKRGRYEHELSPYFFTRDSGVDAVPSPAEFRCDVGVQAQGVDQIIWCGHNDLNAIPGRIPGYPDMGRMAQGVVRDNLIAMIDHARGAGRPGRWMVLSLLNGSGSGNGRTTGTGPTPYYEHVVRSLNPFLAEHCGPDHFVDIRRWLVEEALDFGRLRPSPQDQLNRLEDVPPATLTLPGNPHLNPLGYQLVARYLAGQLTARGWYR